MIKTIPMHLLLTIVLSFCLAHTTAAGESIAQVRQMQQQIEQGKFDVTLLAVATLSNISVDGFKVSELSGLAWDKDEGLLLALSDNGYVLDLKPVFKGRTLQDILLNAGHRLLDEKGRSLKYKFSDSEGLAIENGSNGKHGDSRLLVSFERIPRLARYQPDGTFISYLTLPAGLDDVKYYYSENKSLESVSIHNTYGIIVGTEFPLAGGEPGTLNIYSLPGQHWSFPAHDKTDGALVDMTILADGRIIALERTYSGLLSGMHTTLHRIILHGTQVQADQIHTFTPEEGLFNDNFEGITHIDGNHFMMVSDVNNHPLKRTLLVYFEINERERISK